MAARLLVLGFAALLAFVPPVLANHPQAAHGDVIVFDHKTGNEWWVEVILSGGASGSVSGVQALDTGGPWVALAKQSWGAWAASFHIEPGHQVRFRALWSGGDQAESCWFTHPAGVEQCGASSSSSTSTSSSSSSSSGGGTFDATFSGVKGNNWWVEAKVTANQPLAGVDARVNCGTTWKPLALRDWGAWAASFNIPSGSKVDFRARSTSGATDLSGGYLWTAATPTSGCSGSSTTTTTPPPAFDATFSGVKGNNWWIQASVSGNQAISKVEARLDCETDAWFPLAKQSWGGWATSLHVRDGQRVDFRATSTSGATDRSGGYTWTAATPAPACPATWPPPPTSGFHATFSNLRGDGDHVEADVTANRPLVAVDARTMNSLVWHPLAKGAGDTWTGDFDVTGHNVVEFRATDTDGSWYVTYQGWYWPYEGSYTTEPRLYPGPGTHSDVYFAAIRGSSSEVWVDTYSIYPLTAMHLRVDDGPWQPMGMDAYNGDWGAGGLSIPYGSTVHLRATYTLATGATTTIQEPGGEGPWPPWPQMGSHYSYREVSSSNGTDDETGIHYETTGDTYIEVSTADGWYSGWQGTCTTITRSFVTPPGQPGHWENRTDTYDFDREPQGAWADAEVGSTVSLRYPSTCAQMLEPSMPVCERASHRTSLRTISGDPITLDAVRGCRSSATSQETFWWDQRHGILLDWRIVNGPSGPGDWQGQTRGWLVDTDAAMT